MMLWFQENEEVVEEKEEKEAPVASPEPEPEPEAEPEPQAEAEAEAKMKKDSPFPVCIGPKCSKQALPDSVYCGTDCIIQHAAFTMKTLSVPKVLKSSGRAQRKAEPARPPAKVGNFNMVTEI